LTPKVIQSQYKDLNFPFIFGKIDVTQDMLNDQMLDNAVKLKRKFPYTCKSMKFNAQNVVLTTPLLKFYLSRGLKVTNVYWAMQFLPEEKPFCRFIDEMVKIRINAVGKNKPLGDRAKFTMNSCIGKVKTYEIYDILDIFLNKFGNYFHVNTFIRSLWNEFRKTPENFICTTEKFISSHQYTFIRE
jgi:hypothetical protein